MWRNPVSIHDDTIALRDLPLCVLPKALRSTMPEFCTLPRQGIYLDPRGAQTLQVIPVRGARILSRVREYGFNA